MITTYPNPAISETKFPKAAAETKAIIYNDIN